jgi:hypothetical protein
VTRTSPVLTDNVDGRLVESHVLHVLMRLSNPSPVHTGKPLGGKSPRAESWVW